MNNPDLDLAWQLVQDTGCNVFLTGKAGTGKTTFLRELVKKTHKRNVVLAPTGIAAINARGATLHSFFQLPFGPYIPGTDPRTSERNYKFSERKRRIIRSLDLVIIDEISMVRADLLDCVDAVLRRYRDRTRPFGGVQLLLIGDLQQLAPVAKQDEWEMLRPYYDTQYFFSSRALREVGFVTVELRHVYRQSDERFIELLNRVRNNQADDAVLAALNARYMPGFSPSQDEGYIRLTTHNYQADNINQRELDKLDSEPHTYDAEIWKEFPEMSYPTADALTLKVGAQVMFVKNDPSPSKSYFNGMIGTVVSMSKGGVKVLPQGGHEALAVVPDTWENMRYNLNSESHEIEEELIGTFTQLPLKTAWAITVHKSQGLTFERAIIDVQHSFSHGQTYVALSRCKSLEGLVLSAPIPRHAIITDNDVVGFTQRIPEQIPTPDRLRDMQREYYLQLIYELYSFVPLRAALDAYVRYADENLYRQCPEELQQWREAQKQFEKQVLQVAASFAIQCQRLVMAGYEYAEDAFLQERCRKAAGWFLEQLEQLSVATRTIHVKTGNKAYAQRLVELMAELLEQLRVKRTLLNYVSHNGFRQATYMRQRALVALGPDEESKPSRATKSKTTRGKAAAGGKSTASGKGSAKGRAKSAQSTASAHSAAETPLTSHRPYDQKSEEPNPYVGEEILGDYEDINLDYDGLPY